MTMRLRSVILPTLRHQLRATQIEQYLARSVRARRRHDPAPGMRARATHVESAYRAPILRVAGKRPVEQQLIQRQLALENIALGQTYFVFQLARRAHLDVANQLLEVRAVPRDLIQNRLFESVAIPVGPVAAVDLWRHILHEYRH